MSWTESFILPRWKCWWVRSLSSTGFGSFISLSVLQQGGGAFVLGVFCRHEVSSVTPLISVDLGCVDSSTFDNSLYSVRYHDSQGWGVRISLALDIGYLTALWNYTIIQGLQFQNLTAFCTTSEALYPLLPVATVVPALVPVPSCSATSCCCYCQHWDSNSFCFCGSVAVPGACVSWECQTHRWLPGTTSATILSPQLLLIAQSGGWWGPEVISSISVKMQVWLMERWLSS